MVSWITSSPDRLWRKTRSAMFTHLLARSARQILDVGKRHSPIERQLSAQTKGASKMALIQIKASPPPLSGPEASAELAGRRPMLKPADYSVTERLRDGSSIAIRALRVDDREEML